jgi:UDP-N-acetylmuramate--alanine ligase
MEVVGTKNGVTVIDDFAHNPDKIAATLKTLHAFDGRLLILFQPHGFGPLKLMNREFIEGFAGLMREDDVLLMPEPVYYGGTTDRSVGSEDIAAGVRALGRTAEALHDRAACGDRIVELARPATGSSSWGPATTPCRSSRRSFWPDFNSVPGTFCHDMI